MIGLDFEPDNTIKINGNLDGNAGEELKLAVEKQAYTRDFTLDMEAVEYIDSAGIGALIALHNQYARKGVAVNIRPSLGVAKLLSASKLDKLFIDTVRKQTSAKKLKTIYYYDSFKADTKIIPGLIDRLFLDLETARYHPEEAHEIVVAVDEAVTNGILETIKSDGGSSDDHPLEFPKGSPKTISIKWEISPNDFSATVIDKGSGLDLKQVEKSIPQLGTEDYLGQVGAYQHRSNLELRVNGKLVELKRLGAGLKIMASFMDEIFIDLIDSKSMITDSVNKTTTGTILTLYRKRRLAETAN